MSPELDSVLAAMGYSDSEIIAMRSEESRLVVFVGIDGMVQELVSMMTDALAQSLQKG